jgi:hypothetical protein
VCCHGCGHVHLGVHRRPADAVAGVAGELGEECALGAAVAFAEGVQGVHVGQERGEPVDELG